MAHEVLDSFIIMLNLIICIILTKKHCQKSTTVNLMDRSILSLSIADILVGITGIVYENRDEIPSPEVLKINLIGKLPHHMLKLTLVISAFHLVIIATERLLAIYKPIIFRFKLKDCHAIYVLIMSWVLATLMYGIAAYLGQNFNNRADNWVFGALAGVCSIFLVVSYTSMYRTLRINNRRISVKPVFVMFSKYGPSSFQKTGNSVNCSTSCSSGIVNGNIITTKNSISSVKNTASRVGVKPVVVRFSEHCFSSNQTTGNTVSCSIGCCSGNNNNITNNNSNSAVKNTSLKKESTNMFNYRRGEENAQLYHEKSCSQVGKQKKVFYLGMSISFAFIVCFLPYMIYGSVYKYHESRKTAFRNVTALSRANSLLNSLIYIWFEYGHKVIRKLKRRL